MSLTDNANAEAILKQIFSEAGRENPYPLYKQMREISPVHHGADGNFYITGHAAAMRLLSERSMGALTSESLDTVRPDWRVHPAYTTMYAGMFTQNPPGHTRLRKLAMDAFTPRRIEGLRARISELVARFIARIEERGADGAPIDFMEDFAFPIPMIVIGNLLGLPEVDHEPLREIVRHWGYVFEPFPSEEEVKLADAGATKLWEYLGDLVAERKKQPRDDLVTAFLNGAPNGDRFSPPDLLNMLASLYSAGFETTTHLMANGLMALLESPAQAQLLRTDPALGVRAVDELLRYDASAQMVFRVAIATTVVDKTTIEAGEHIVVITGAANRDPRAFSEPDLLDLTRSPNPHLTFSHGIHFCLGAALARLEGEIAFPALMRRFPSIRLAGPATRRPSHALRGYDKIPLTVD
ncbi:cytochrome P450 [Microbispora sp. ATCC PTA-5024]|uniref:cytochrome P450 n=1 Tax=Microbispora sp. ATCC PTA-5024 TaxID=316330 RepID=UPI0003DC48A6|nr:cytochrome P450 [Microbispora sp. ATCC PTA-5024]ETK32816.1 hypothetical protein MPTA5024_27710 [Microbispora sp. ATCC PTA-5024]